MMLRRAFYDPDIRDNAAQTSALHPQWDGAELPGEEIFAAFAADMKAAHRKQDSRRRSARG